MKKVMFAAILLFAFSCGSNNNSKDDNEDLFDLGKKKELSEESKRLDTELSSYLGMYAPLPEQAKSENNPHSKEKIELGHFLYYDSTLSLTGNNSCNSCHNLATFGVDNKSTSTGDKGENGARNSPTVLNAALHTSQFWDGRAKDVEEQAGMPILNPVEMAIPNEKYLEEKLRNIQEYKDRFTKAFPKDVEPITYDNIKKSIALFERELLTPTKFDDYLKGDKGALNEEEKKGFLLFNQIGCNACHSGALLGGNLLQKFGEYGNYWDYTNSKIIDEGKFAETKNEADKYVFKTPSLRNIDKTAPYFHDGSVSSLEESIKIMAKVQLNKDLTEAEVKSIAVFLRSLTGDIDEKYKRPPVKVKS